ncbi:putative hydrolase (alpha/beta fold) [Mycobacterium paraintracellulare]|nr:alpha/beta hydrolase [Mycobacterium paraintracellulare]BCO39948.1 putative hydrolase (alpha/beta fold) [Mycobacterium paraintracellulare]
MTLTQERIHTRDGITLVADCYRHPTTGPVVLLLHGGGQNRHAWATTARRLHAHGYTVIAYDTRGHGDSDWDPSGQYDVEKFVADLLSVREHVGTESPPALVGASLGGLTILATHLLAPAGLWAAVILVDITPRMEFHGARRIVSFMAAHPDGFGTLTDAADIIAEYNPRRPRPENLDGLHKVLRQRSDGRWVWRWDPAFISSNFDVLQGELMTDTEEFEAISGFLAEGARRITAPTLLVRGALSDVVSEETVNEFLELVPHAETTDVTGTGHMVAGDDNDAFTSAVTDF